MNEEFEVGYDADFEARWWRAEQAGRWVMLAVILVAASGLLGRGPLGRAHLSDPGGRLLRVGCAHVVRYGAPSVITVDAAPGPGPGLALRLSPSFGKAFALGRVTPRPISETVGPNGLLLRFAARGGGGRPVSILLDGRPGQLGAMHLALGRPGRPPLSWTEYVVP